MGTKYIPMIQLPDVTLICMTGLGYKTQEHLDALKASFKELEFGAVKFIMDKKIDNVDDWNKTVIYDLPRYVFTSHALFIHGDGYVINPELWNDEWLELDYVGSPWPLPRWQGEFEDEEGNVQRVGNGVGLRSKKLMDLAATRPLEYHYGNNNEDGHIACWNRKWLEEQGCKFGSFEQALLFSKEHELPENKDLKTFMFHKAE